MPFKNIAVRTTPRAKTMQGKPLEERLWAKIDKRGPDECWPWLGAIDHNGYGKLFISPGCYGRSHRLAWEDTRGESLADLHLRHSCDVPGCCNPAHLIPGTNQDNIDDRRARNRHWRKLTPEQVDEIRALHGKVTQQSLAHHYGVSVTLIQKIQYHTARLSG